MNTQKPHWALDRNVPLALILAILLQTGAAVWWAGNMAARVAVLEENNVATKQAIQELTEIKVHMAYQRDSLQSIEQFLKDRVDWKQ